MEAQVIFAISVLMGVVVWGVIGARYIWPALRLRPRPEALRPLLLLHAFRYVGLAYRAGATSPRDARPRVPNPPRNRCGGRSEWPTRGLSADVRDNALESVEVRHV
jgi:hypothetical protein